jgi:hypothetical protein
MVLLAKVALGLAGTVVVGTGLLCSEGFVNVKVIENRPQGHHVRVIAPAILAPIAVRLVPRHNLENASAQIRPWLPAIRAGLDQLRECDDVVFVDVRDRNDHVEIAKRGGSIVVDADEQGQSVHVSVPIRAISSTIAQLSAADSHTEP